MNVHNKWSTSSCHSSSSKLSTLATATTFRNSSDAGSSRNNSPTNISGTWSNSCRSFDTFDSDVEDEFVRRRRGIIISYLLLLLRYEEDNNVIFRKFKSQYILLCQLFLPPNAQLFVCSRFFLSFNSINWPYSVYLSFVFFHYLVPINLDLPLECDHNFFYSLMMFLTMS